YWRFNEGQGTTAYDMSAYENHANITAPVWTTEAAPIEPGKPPVVASRPDPANGELYPNTWVTLTWRPGDFAVSHDVYLGDTFDDVNTGAAHTFQGNVASPMQIIGFAGYPLPDGLVPGTTYYWRIDGVNDADPNSPWKGDVWSFWIPSPSAYAPSPSDGAEFVGTEVTLRWQPGYDAKLHNIVFGDNFDDVNNAPAGSAVTTTSFDPDTLERGKTYYWRVDEFNPPTTIKGDVWSFTTVPNIPIADPNLVGWWMFEEGLGSVVVDSSGYDNHGTLQSDPQWAAGYDGGGLSFDGIDDFVQVPHAEILTVDSEVTVMAWVNTSRHGGPGTQGYQGIVAKGNPPRSYSLYTQSAGTLHFSTTSAGAYVGSSSDSQVPLNEWVHVAAMVAGGEHLYYINGEPAGTGGGGIELPGTADTATVVIGRTNEGATRSFLGMIDDVRVYNRALTQDEIKEIMRGDMTLAWNPTPANGSTPDVTAVLPLSWSAGEKAAQHDVYFGVDKDSVDSADASDTSGVYRGRQNGTSHDPAEGVEWGGGPYYWRVDESNTDGTISKGRTWSFTVADFLLVDDFESYNDIDPPDANSYRIFDVWIDGFGTTTNGALVGNDLPPYAERTVVHEGAQSMIYRYDNNLKTSEATLTLVDRRDWTEEGVTKLSLWLIGDAASSPERLFVALNGTAVVYHDDQNVTQTAAWTEWVIDLTSFADQGVNLANVDTITIGFGTKNAPAAGGTGTMYFDDIRLYR
ncbi:MAG: LamG-like jellyroll fold domain-containing protein, partial [Planctomycetota bacterium]